MEYEEKTAQADYAELMADSQETRAGDSKALTGKQTTKAEVEATLMTTKEIRGATSTDLKQIATVISTSMLPVISSWKISICVRKHAPVRSKVSRMPRQFLLEPASASELLNPRSHCWEFA